MFNNQFDIPLPLALWLAVDEYDPSKYDNEISATGLLKSPRYIMAQLRAKYPEKFPKHLRPFPMQPNEYPDVQERIAVRIGTALHSSVEKAFKDYFKQGLLALRYPESQIERVAVNPTEPTDKVAIYLEKRSYKQVEINGITFTISGQFDIVIDGELHDIKTTSTYSYESGCWDRNYIRQGSIYRWLNPDLITSDDVTINFLFLDYKKYMDNRNKNYPPAKAYFKKYPLMPIHETEEMIMNKLRTIVRHWDSPLELIPCCSDKDLYKSPSVFKYYKNGFVNSTRATKNFNSLSEATAYRAKQGYTGEIIEDRGKPFHCPYCIVESDSNASIVHHNFTVTIQ